MLTQLKEQLTICGRIVFWPCWAIAAADLLATHAWHFVTGSVMFNTPSRRHGGKTAGDEIFLSAVRIND